MPAAVATSASDVRVTPALAKQIARAASSSRSRVAWPLPWSCVPFLVRPCKSGTLQTFVNVCNLGRVGKLHCAAKPCARTVRQESLPCPSPFALARPVALPIAARSPSLAACGQSQQGGGFHGFPPAEVTTVKLEPKTLPATYEYVGQTTGSKEVEVRARVTGILEKKLFQEGAPVQGGPGAVRHRPQAARRRRSRRSRPRSCARRRRRRRPSASSRG